MIYLIFLVFGFLFIYLMVRNNELENTNIQHKREQKEKFYYDEYKRLSTTKLKKELKEIQDDYNELLSVAKRRYEKDDNRPSYSGKTYYFVDGTPIEQPEEDPRYMACNDEEMNLYYRYNVIRDIIERRDNKI